MTRLVHIILLAGPAVLIPFLAESEQHIIKYFMVHIAVIVPISTIWRMKSYGYSFKEILAAMIPFYGYSKQLEIFQKEKRTST